MYTTEQIQKLFDSEQGWTSAFVIDGKTYGGSTPLENDPRLLWHIEQAGGVRGKSVLELGPLEGAHTKTLFDHGARQVIAIEGNPGCYRRCRVVQDVFNLDRVTFLQSDFCKAAAAYADTKARFDIVSAAGVLYHQLNPAKLIFDLAKITNVVFVWSHVAGPAAPTGEQTEVFGDEYHRYRGRFNHYGNGRTNKFCAGLNDWAVWLYADEMLKCFDDAGFKNVTVKEHGPHPNGNYILLIAKK